MSEQLKWIEAIWAGDYESFRHIVSRYKNALYSVSYGVLGDSQLAEDAVQESFLQAFLALRNLREPDKIGNWLYSIAYRNSIRLKNKRKQLLFQNDFSDFATPSESVESTVLRREDHALIRQSIEGLDEKNRITVVLHYWCNFKMKEIADFLGISVRAVESRLQRAKKKLRASLSIFEEAVIPKPMLGKSFDERIMKEIPKLLRIPCIFVDVRDIDVAMSWYESVLGIDFNSREPAAGVNIAFRETSHPTASHGPILTFATSSITEAYSALQASKVPMSQLPPDGHSFTFEDPFGNVLAFVEQ